MNWWVILSSLLNFMRAHADLRGVNVCAGGDAQVPECRTVQLLRGETVQPQRLDTVPGAQTIYVECWEHDESQDAGRGYEKLAALEVTVSAVVAQWQASQPFPQAELGRDPLGSFKPDGDMYRPSIGSQAELVVKWRPRPV